MVAKLGRREQLIAFPAHIMAQTKIRGRKKRKKRKRKTSNWHRLSFVSQHAAVGAWSWPSGRQTDE